MAIFSDVTGCYGDNSKLTPVPFPKGIIVGSEADVVTPSLPLTLTVTSKKVQVLNPGSAGDVILPTTSVESGYEVNILNRSTSNRITIKSSNGDTIDSVMSGDITLVALQAAPTTSAHWVVVSVTESGVYTPTISNTSGLTSTVSNQMVYQRVGRTVTASWQYDVTVSGNANIGFQFSLPIEPVANFSTQYGLSGSSCQGLQLLLNGIIAEGVLYSTAGAKTGSGGGGIVGANTSGFFSSMSWNLF